MNLKYYLRGLGIGIILTTVILSIVNRNKVLSDQEIIDLGMVMKEDETDDLYELLENAKTSTDTKTNNETITPAALGDVEASEEDKSKTENTDSLGKADNIDKTDNTDITDNTNNTGNSDDNNIAENGNEIDDGNGHLVNQSEQENVDKSVNTDKNNDNTSDDVITFSIDKGMSSEEVSIILEEIGLIEDAKDFNLYIVKVGKDKVIGIGTYTLSANSTYDDIIKVITKEKMSN